MMGALWLQCLIVSVLLWQQCISFRTNGWLQGRGNHQIPSYKARVLSTHRPLVRSGESVLSAGKPHTQYIATPSLDTHSRPSNRRARGPNKRKQAFPHTTPSSFTRGHNPTFTSSPASSSSPSPLSSSPVGRVSVYCVGAKIDLVALRAHVFRRGFSTQTPAAQEEDSLAAMHLTRRAENALLDDEVLHVSNAPLLISDSLSTPNSASHSLSDTLHSHLTTNAQSDTDDIERTGLAPEDMELTQDSDAETETERARASDTQSHYPRISDAAREQLLMATQDIFYFEYGVVVFWGLSSREEKAALTELEKFTIEPVTPDELENSFDTMEYEFDHKANPHRPIKFDLMKLRSVRVEEKLAFAYALAQSSKLFVFESKVLQSVERTRYLPKELAQRGKITCSKRELNRLIGQLFVEQTEVNLFSCILDSPDFLWDDDEFLPTYQSSRQYLEVDQRVTLLNSRLSVIRELLDVLTAQVADSNSTRLEWIVIWLIAIEIALGIATNPWFAAAKRATATAAAAIPAVLFLYKQMLSTWEK